LIVDHADYQAEKIRLLVEACAIPLLPGVLDEFRIESLFGELLAAFHGNRTGASIPSYGSGPATPDIASAQLRGKTEVACGNATLRFAETESG
jgi:hypothetical protein